ncbi:lipopolysaccharide biosynthesis protein [Gemmatimonadota bacterium]
MLIRKRLARPWFFQTDFAKHVAVLSTGVLLAQMASFLLTPVVSRLYLPGTYGLLALFMSLVSPLGNVSAFKYDHAILIAEDRETADQLLSVSVIAIGVLCVVSACVLLLLRVLNDAFLPSLGLWIFALPVFVLTSGLIRVLSSRCTRDKRFKAVSSSNAFGGLATPLLRIAYAVLASASLAGLLLGQLITNLGKILILNRGKREKRSRQQTVATLWGVAKRYGDFPLLSVPNGLLFSVGSQAPVLMLAVFFESSAVGLFAMASRLMRLPVDLLSQPIRLVFTQTAAERLHRGEPLFPFVGLLAGIMAAAMIIPFMVVEVYGETLFSVVLGERWRAAGTIAKIICPWIMMMFIITPLSAIYTVFRIQGIWLRFQLALNLCLLAYFLWAFLHPVPMPVLLGTLTGINVLVYLFILGHILYLTKRHDSKRIRI